MKRLSAFSLLFSFQASLSLLAGSRTRTLPVATHTHSCNVRFWHIHKGDAMLANRLAEMGALKSKQRPQVVRWRRKGFNEDHGKEERENARKRMLETMTS